MADIVAPGLDQTAVQSLINSSVPKPAVTMPPGVSDSGAIGTDQRYALANHTHASKARKQRVTGVNTATYTWVYPTAFPAGTVPICNAIAEDPANSALELYNVQIVGVPTATQCTFRISRLTTGLFALLTGALGFNNTPGNINLHCLALEP